VKKSVPQETIVKDPQNEEVLYSLKPMPGGIKYYSVEEFTIRNNVVVKRQVITEKDAKHYAMSKLLTFVETKYQ
jgi:hypothetical protein